MSAVNDPVSDFLTQIRNAIKADKRRVEIPSSNMKAGLAKIMKEHRLINDFEIIEDNKQNVLRVLLRYTNGVSAVSGLKRISRPGLRQYCSADDIPRVLNGLGIAVISTSKGLLSDKQARRDHIGGEIVCHIW